MAATSRRGVVIGAFAGLSISVIHPRAARADPITLAGAASFVALALAQGALSYVGGKAMSAILGDPTISDVKAWISKAVAELEAYFKAELQHQLEQQVVDQVTADIQGVSTNLYEYAMLSPTSQPKNRFLLEYSDTKTAELIPLSLKHEAAMFIALSAMGYRLMTLYSLYLLDKDKGHVLSHRPMMDDFVRSVVKYRDYAGHLLSSDVRVGGPTCDIVGGGEEGSAHSYARCTLFLDDRIQGTYLGAKFADALAKAKGPSEALKATVTKDQLEFLAKINDPLKTHIAAYDAMCRQVKSSYTPPIAV